MTINQRSIQKYFRLAKNASEFSDFPRYHLGAIIVCGNKVVSIGWNVVKENPIQKQYNKYREFDVDVARNSLHAEMMSIVRAKKMDIDFGRASIFVYREYKNGELAIAKPCPACMNAIRDIGIKDIYYTGNGSYVHERLR